MRRVAGPGCWVAIVEFSSGAVLELHRVSVVELHGFDEFDELHGSGNELVDLLSFNKYSKPFKILLE